MLTKSCSCLYLAHTSRKKNKQTTNRARVIASISERLNASHKNGRRGVASWMAADTKMLLLDFDAYIL